VTQKINTGKSSVSKNVFEFRLLKSKYGVSATREDLGEFHMGASHIRIILDREFYGVREFHSTNGELLFSEYSPHAILYDGLILIVFDYQYNQASHLCPPQNKFISEAKFFRGGVELPPFKAQSDCDKNIKISFGSDQFLPGLGKAQKGQLPSIDLEGLRLLKLNVRQR